MCGKRFSVKSALSAWDITETCTSLSLIHILIDCAHAPTKKGLVLMDTPCYDMLSVTAKAAGGAQLIVFTTGRGNAIGNPVVPVMKVTANGDTYRKLSDNIDLDMSPVLELSLIHI